MSLEFLLFIFLNLRLAISILDEYSYEILTMFQLHVISSIFGRTLMFRLPFILFMLISSVSPAFAAGGVAPRLESFDTKDLFKLIDGWMNKEIVRLSISAQNDRYSGHTNEKIIKLDKQWRSERKNKDKPLISATLSSPLSVYLSRMQGQSLGLFAEIFVMDNKGLNVGQSSITSDFWQGDEAKFQKTYPVGANAIFIDEPEWDEKLGIWRVQINKTLTDVTGKKPIGAATIEVNLTEFVRRNSLSQ